MSVFTNARGMVLFQRTSVNILNLLCSCLLQCEFCHDHLTFTINVFAYYISGLNKNVQ